MHQLKGNKMKRPYRIKVSFSFSEQAVIKQRANATGRTPARFIREGILEREIKLKQFSPEEKQVFIALTGIARNLNQIAKKYNQGEKPVIEFNTILNQVKCYIDKLTGNDC
jgi:hypothetical protein